MFYARVIHIETAPHPSLDLLVTVLVQPDSPPCPRTFSIRIDPLGTTAVAADDLADYLRIYRNHPNVEGLEEPQRWQWLMAQSVEALMRRIIHGGALATVVLDPEAATPEPKLRETDAEYARFIQRWRRRQPVVASTLLRSGTHETPAQRNARGSRRTPSTAKGSPSPVT
ncbi:MAG: hypothetical protein NZ898_13575 [Myxococcota bacterium]|nr:hypothetical protein [Myxococcota bacterium]MDW8363148.1 hypothetical protein [Myxococcales bacterium]